jgi:hypothetical protein
VTKVVGDELQAAKADGFAQSEANASRVATISNESKFQLINHVNVQRKSALQIPLPGMPAFRVFCTGKLWGGQDHAFQFRGGLANYEAHYDLSWFRPVHGGNSPMSSSLILKMSMCYKWVSRDLENFT